MKLVKIYGFRIILILSLLLPFLQGERVTAEAIPQQTLPAQKAAALLNRMTPEERVGQVFLVTYNGTNVGHDSKIYDLIKKYHIGGVLLKAANDNFPESDTAAQDILKTTSDLQQTAWDTSQTNNSNSSTYAP